MREERIGGSRARLAAEARLAGEASRRGRGPDPSFAAMVFEACEGVLGPEPTAGKSKG